MVKKISSFIIKFATVLFVLFVPYSISLIGISVSLLGLGYISLCIAERKVILPDKKVFKNVVYIMLLIIATMIISTVFSYDVVSGVKRTITVFGYFIVFVTISSIDDENFLKNMIHLLLFSCCVHSIYAILQYFTGIDIMNKGYQKYNRVIGIVGYPNSLAGVLGLVLPVSFCFSYYLKKLKLLYIFVMLVVLIATILTFTRGIWLGITACLLVISLLSDKRIFMFLIFFLLILLVIPISRTRIIKTFKTGETVRIQFLKLTPKFIFKRPLFGYGPDSFRKVFYNTFPNFPEKGHFHPHNMYLHILFETGIAGLFFFLVLFYYKIKTFIQLYLFTQDLFNKMLVLSVLGSIFVFLIYGLVDEPFRAHFAPYVLFFLTSVSYRFGLFEQK